MKLARHCLVLVATGVAGIATAGLIELTPAGFADEAILVTIAPDQQHAAFLVHEEEVGNTLWWVPVDGSSDPVQLSGAPTTISELTIAPGSDMVAYVAFGGGLAELWVTPVNSPAPVKVSTPSADGRVNGPRFTADGSRVVYREGPNGGFRRLWSAPVDGSSPAVGLSPASDNCSRFELTADPATVVFHAYQPAVDRSELFTAATDGSAPPQRLSLFPGDPMLDDEELTAVSDWQLSPDGQTVVYIAQRHWPDDPGNLAGDAELYAVAAAGPSGSEVRLDPDEPPAQKAYNDVTEGFTLSPDGATVVFQFDRQAELEEDRIDHHLFSVPIDGSSPPTEVADSTDHVFSFIAAAGRAVYLGGDTSVADSLRSVPFSGGAFVTLDGDPVSSRVLQNGYLTTPDGQRVVYPVGTTRELWSIAADGTGGPVELTPPLGFQGDVQPDFQITAAGASVLFTSDLELSGLYELYAVSTTGGPASKLNDPPLTGRRVFAVLPTTDERCVLFTADTTSSGPRRLFAADLHGLCASSAELFADGFESGDLTQWSGSAGGP